MPKITKEGHYKIYDKNIKKYVYEHRVVWEKVNGKVPDGMHIHHINGIPNDNRIENLMLIDPLTHKRLHTGCIIIDGVWWKTCQKCGVLKRLDTGYTKPGINKSILSLCIECTVEYHKEYQVKYYQKNKAKLDICHKEYYKNNETKFEEYREKYKLNNKEKIKEDAHAYYMRKKQEKATP